jgi:hypothetical protein
MSHARLRFFPGIVEVLPHFRCGSLDQKEAKTHLRINDPIISPWVLFKQEERLIVNY